MHVFIPSKLIKELFMKSHRFCLLPSLSLSLLNQDDFELFFLISFFEEMPSPLKSGAPSLFCIMGHKIIILFSELLEICSSGV